MNALESGLEIDIVLAGAPQADDFDAAGNQFFDYRSIQVIVDENADAVVTGRQFSGLGIELCFKVTDIKAEVAVRFIERLLVIRPGIKKSDFTRHRQCLRF